MELKLTQGKVTLIDEEDWERVSGFGWYAILTAGGMWRVVATLPNSDGHKKVYLHRLLLNAPSNRFVDHISGDTLDNRKANLRICTNAENQQNSSGRLGASRFKGVSWFARRSRWRVAFNWKGKTHFVGYFADEEEAARAYDAAILPLAGEFARLNFPKP